jgi:hypothetical protein
MSNVLQFSLGLGTGGFLQQIGAAQAGLGRLLGVTVGLGGVMAGVWKTIEHGAALDDLSKVTGETVENLFKLERGFELAGASAGSVQGVLFRLSKALGGVSEMGEPTKDVFAAMGLSLDQLKGKGSAAALSDVLAALARLNRDQAANAASKIFGRGSAQDMLLLANNTGDFAAGMKSASEGAAKMAIHAHAFDQLTDSIKLLKGQLTDLFIGPAGAFADMANSLIAAFEHGQLGNVITLSFNTAFEKSIAYLSSLLANPDFWSGLYQTGIAVFAKLGTALLQILSGPLEKLAGSGLLTLGLPLPGRGKIPGMVASLAEENERLAKEFLGAGWAQLKGAHALAGINTTPSESLLNDLLATLGAEIAKLAGTGNGDERGKKRLGKIDVGSPNALERIGAIFGGGSQSTSEHIRRTADNTTKLLAVAEHHKRIAEMMARRDFGILNAP